MQQVKLRAHLVFTEFFIYLFFSGAPETMASQLHAFPRASNPGQAARSFANLCEGKWFKSKECNIILKNFAMLQS